MSSFKRLRCFLIMFIFLLVVGKAFSQTIDEKDFRHKMRLMDSLSFYKMKDYDALYKISLSYNLWGNEFNNICYGWIRKQDKENIFFLHTNGKETQIKKKQVIAINKLPINDSTIDIFVRKKKDAFRISHFDHNYLLSLWLYQTGQPNFSKKALLEPVNQRFLNDDNLRDCFGIIYYDAMLSAFSQDRNYQEAIILGDHLSLDIFKGYKYQNEAMALVRQLKKDTGDYKSFRLPDSVEWSSIKLKLSRKEQIFYLADRLRLLDCIQPGQPGSISYEMPQFSISFAEAAKLKVSYWRKDVKYNVINPFIELLKMKPDLQEVKLILPYLLSEEYITSYSYFRDFRPERTLHKCSWVVHDLIFEVTDNIFYYPRSFDSLSYDQKKAEVEKIRKWCDENGALTKEQRVIETLKTTDDWNDFKKALETARNEKYSSLPPAIVGRYDDFKKLYWPVHKGLIAETVYELGNEKYVETMRKWSSDTSGIRDTSYLDVKFWTSLFLLKYDKSSYEYAMTILESVLKKDDGTAYYPNAMGLLLSMKNDKRAFKLAEGMIDKNGFITFIDLDYYLNFVKELLLLKSDYTYNFINKKIGAFTPDEAESFNKNNGNIHVLMESDFYVMAVDKLKSDKPGYNPGVSYEIRLEYRKALSKWFTTQYNFLKKRQPNDLHLGLVNGHPLVKFVDAPNN